MPGLSNYLETFVLKHLLSSAQTRPSSVWISLHSATVTDDANGAEISTVGTNYNRMTYANTSGNWSTLGAASSAANSTAFNKLAVSFSSATSSYTVNAVGLWDSSNTGNLLFLSSVATKVVEIGDVPTISSADLRISFD